MKIGSFLCASAAIITLQPGSALSFCLETGSPALQGGACNTVEICSAALKLIDMEIAVFYRNNILIEQNVDGSPHDDDFFCNGKRLRRASKNDFLHAMNKNSRLYYVTEGYWPDYANGGSLPAGTIIPLLHRLMDAALEDYTKNPY